ncbi:MAG TPA: hypothetical protein VK694_03220 [Verrucomicrobiae bacterium]|nr:hypothetical protein [Verrucomicrobiae bacterium]
MKRVKPFILAGIFVISQLALSFGVLSGQARAVTYPQAVKVSDGLSGAESNGDSTRSALSANGAFVAFQSHANNLVAGDTNSMMDVFVKNLSTNATERVSLNDSDQQVSAASNFTDRVGSEPTISQDGRLVTFVSAVPALTGYPSFNYKNQVFLRDRQTATTQIVSSDGNGVVANAHSNFGKLSANGQWVVFYSAGTNLVSSDTNGRIDLFIKNLATGAVELVSVSSDEVQGNADTDYPHTDALDISPDGRYVLFASTASNLVASDPNGNTIDVFLRDRQTGTTERFAPTDCATMGSTYAGGTISDDGRWVAFSSQQCTTGTGGKVTLLDRQTSALTVVNGMNNATDFSADGRYLLADNSNIFRYDRTTNTSTVYVPNAEGGTMSATGNSFSYFAQDYYSQYPVGPKPGDTNQLNDLFVYQLAAEPTPIYTYSGTLKDQAGNPLRGTVQLQGPAGGIAPVTTDPITGAFSLQAPAGQYRIVATANSQIGFASSVGMMSGPDVVDLTGSMSQNLVVNFVKYKFKVVYPDGSPAQGVDTQITQQLSSGAYQSTQLLPGQTVTLSGALQRNQPTDANGIVAFDMMPNAPITQVNFGTKPGYGNPPALSNLAAITQDMTDGDAVVATLIGPVTYSGTLKDQAGNPLRGSVQLQGPAGGIAPVNTDPATGAFSVQALPGQYSVNVTVNSQTGFSSFVGIQSPAATVNLTGNLTQDLVVNFVKYKYKVIYPNGSPATGVNVGMTQQPTAGTQSVQLLPGLQTSLSGSLQRLLASGGDGLVPLDVLANVPLKLVYFNTPPAGYSLPANQTDVPGISQDMTDSAAVLVPLIPDAVPTVPSGLAGPSPTASAPVLGWNTVLAASSFKIFRDGVEVGSPAVPGFTDSALAQDSTYAYTVSACNQVGCSAQSGPVNVAYDTTSPTLGSPSWFNNPAVEGNNATVTVPVADNVSGVAAGEYYLGTDPGQGNATAMNLNANELTASLGDGLAPGTYTVHIRAKDAVGHWSTVIDTQLVILPLDTTAPVISYTFSTPPNANGWHKAPVTLNWTVQDAESTVISQTGCAQVTVNTDGSYAYFCSATSAGGAANQSVTVKYDATLPVVGRTLSTPANANGWHKADVTIDWQATDTGSGSPTDPANTVASTQAANVTYTSAQSCDLAGNCATGSAQVSLDKVAPTQSNFTPAMLFLVVGSQNFSTTATDALSGVNRVEYYFDTDPGQGSGTAATHTTGSTYTGIIDTGSGNFFTSHNFFLRTQDRAGNWSTTLTRNYSELF